MTILTISFLLTGCDEEPTQTDTNSGEVYTLDGVKYYKPIANAGEDETHSINDVIEFDASNSSDSDGEIVSFIWKENITVLSNDMNFVTSELSVGEHNITLHVTDNDGATAIDEIIITITANILPVANAGDDISIHEGETLRVDAALSSDADGKIVEYTWSEDERVLSNEPVLEISTLSIGSHSITLHVKDNDGDSGSDIVVVEVLYVSNSLLHNGVNYKTVRSLKTGRIWLDRNLGATQVCEASNDEKCYGDYYQWGRESDGHEKELSNVVDTQATTLENLADSFITATSSYEGDWAYDIDRYSLVRNQNWAKIDGSSICPIGFRVPIPSEVESELAEVDDVFSNFLKLPYSGYRNYFSAKVFYQGVDGFIYTNTLLEHRASFIVLDNNGAHLEEGNRASGRSVRCIKE